MHEGVLRHFEQYIKDLRYGNRTDLTDAFQKAISLFWKLEEGANVIGMTEAAFNVETGSALTFDKIVTCQGLTP